MFLLQVKEYPGYNFIGLIFGPAGDTQKRFEKVSIWMMQLLAIVWTGYF